MREGKVTCCAPILRKNIEYWKRKATWYATDTAARPLDVPDEVLA
jgi:hypothetical protein